MRPETREHLALVGKSVLVVLGGILASAGLVDVVVDGAGVENVAYLVAGLLLAGVPLLFAFRSAARAGRAPPENENG